MTKGLLSLITASVNSEERILPKLHVKILLPPNGTFKSSFILFRGRFPIPRVFEVINYLCSLSFLAFFLPFFERPLGKIRALMTLMKNEKREKMPLTQFYAL